MMTELVLQTPEVFKPLDKPSRYKGAYGGRGSGKSWHFASMVVERCLLKPGSRIGTVLTTPEQKSALLLSFIAIPSYAPHKSYRWH
jgi:phage terminase large subunit